MSQWPADRRHAHFSRLRIKRLGNPALAVTVDQQIMHLQQQGRGRGQPELPRHRRTVRPANPDTDQVARRHTNRPGVAKAITGAGLPGEARALHQLRTRIAVRARLAAENSPHNPGGARRQQTPLMQPILRLKTQSRSHAAAGKGAVTADQFFQPAAGTAENQRQVGLSQGRQQQRHPGAAQLTGKAFRPVGFQQLHSGQVERGGQRLTGGHRTAKTGGEVAGAVIAVTSRHILQQGLGVNQPLIQGHAIEKRFQRRTR